MNKSARFFIYDNLFSMTAYWGCSGTVVAALTSYYNIPLAVSNMLTGLTSTLALLQLIGGLIYARTKRKNRFLQATNLIWRLLLPVIFASVLLPLGIGAAVMCFALVAMVAVYHFSCPAQTEWMVSTVEGRVKGTYFSVREMTFMLGLTVVSCTVNLLMDKYTRAGAVKTAFLIICVLLSALIALSFFSLHGLPPVAEHTVEKPPLHKMIGPVLRNKAFMHVLVTNLMLSIANMFVGSFAAVYQIRTIGVSFAAIMVWATAGNFLRALATPLMAKLAARIGWKHIIQLMMVLMLCNAVGWMLITTQNMQVLFPLLSILGALPYAGLGVAFLQLQVDTIPSDSRSLYFSVTSTLNGIGSLGGSLICSALIGILESIGGTAALKYVFLVGAVGFVLTAVLAQLIKSKSKAV